MTPAPRLKTVLRRQRRTILLLGIPLILLLTLVAVGDEKGDKSKTRPGPGDQKVAKKTIEEKTRVHRLSSTKRTAYDAFVYVNRIPEFAGEGETPQDLAGRIFGRLANQEGRILLKLPPGMDRQAYLGYKTFLRYEGKTKVGNCVACHAPVEFTDLKSHIVAAGGSPQPTPSLRNLRKRKVDLHMALLAKIAVSQQPQSGKAKAIDKEYAKMHLDKMDIPGLVAFLKLLNDVSDSDFRGLILKAKLLDTSQDIEGQGDTERN